MSGDDGVCAECGKHLLCLSAVFRQDHQANVCDYCYRICQADPALCHMPGRWCYLHKMTIPAPPEAPGAAGVPTDCAGLPD